MSILTIAAAPPRISTKLSSTIYLFDIYLLPRPVLQPVFQLFTSSSVRKVFFDGRMDFSALFHDLGVDVVNAVDLQLAEIRSRQELEFERLGQIKKYIKDPEHVKKNKGDYREVRKLRGMSEVLRILGLVDKSEGPPKNPQCEPTPYLRRLSMLIRQCFAQSIIPYGSNALYPLRICNTPPRT